MNERTCLPILRFEKARDSCETVNHCETGIWSRGLVCILNIIMTEYKFTCNMPASFSTFDGLHHTFLYM